MTECGRIDPRWLERATGRRTSDLRLELSPLRGGLVSPAVMCARARYRDRRGARSVYSFVVKSLPRADAREACLYRHVADSPLARHLPRLLHVHRAGGREHLMLELVRPVRRWPWSDMRLARSVMAALASLHALTPGHEFRTTLSNWDYEQELAASAQQTLQFVEAACRAHGLPEIRCRLRPLRRVVERLVELRRDLIAFQPLGTAVIHGDVHTGNVLIRRRHGADLPVLLDWERARLGSPLEDVSSWLQSLSFWEPEARRRHDTLLAAYLAARGMPTSLPRPLRRAYWQAAASNVLAGALRYHVATAVSARSAPRQRAAARAAARDAMRVLRRADALMS